MPGSAPPHPQRAWKMFFPFSTALGYASSQEGMYMYVHKFYTSTSMQVHIYIYSVYRIYTRKYMYIYIYECMFSLLTVLLRPNTSSHISSFFVTEATLRCRIDDQKSSRSQHHFGHWDLNMSRWLRGLRLISSDRIHHLNKESGNEYGFPFWKITRDIPSSFSFGWPFWSCFHPNLPLIFLL